MPAIELDGGSFIGTDLSGQTLIYRGGAIPNLAATKVHGAKWSFEDAAANTLVMWAYMESADPKGARKLLEQARQQFRANMRRIPTN